TPPRPRSVPGRGLERRLQLQEALVVHEPHFVGLVVQLDPLDSLHAHASESGPDAEVGAGLHARAIARRDRNSGGTDADAIVEPPHPEIERGPRLPYRLGLDHAIHGFEARWRDRRGVLLGALLVEPADLGAEPAGDAPARRRLDPPLAAKVA